MIAEDPPITRTHDGRISTVEVLHIVRQSGNIFLSGDNHTTGHRGSNEFVAAHTHTTNGLFEGHHGCPLHKWDLQTACADLNMPYNNDLSSPSSRPLLVPLKASESMQDWPD